MEKVFVIFKVRGFSRNLRKEVSKNPRYYFFDNGVRNTLIQNFNPLPLRNDIGQLWENFLMVERRKANEVADRSANMYFWRTYDQKEIDYVEERGGGLYGFEFKWQGEMKAATRQEFLEAYPNAVMETVSPREFRAVFDLSAPHEREVSANQQLLLGIAQRLRPVLARERQEDRQRTQAAPEHHAHDHQPAKPVELAGEVQR